MKHIYTFLWLILALAAPLAGVAQSKGTQPSDPSGTNDFYATACVSYEWRDSTYTQSGTYYDTVVNDSDTTVFTLHLTINQPSAGIDVQTHCGSYTWMDGVTYTASTNTPTFTLPNAANCDSVVTLHLTINNSTTGDTTATDCESFTWHGKTYTQSGDYFDTLTNAAQCDSIVTLHLTIYHGTHNVDTVAACENYTWHEVTYFTSGVYIYPYTNGTGCPSVDTLKLTINNGTHNVQFETVCESFTWHDSTYTTSGTYTYEYINANGCPSVDTLKLTVNTGTHNAFNVDTCESYNWYGQTYTTSGTYTYAYTNAAGCESVDTLHLTVHHGTHNVETETACESFSWHGITYEVSGIYVYPYTNNDGCSSADTLKLTVNHGTHNVIFETACESFTWHGATYSTSGTYTYAYTNAENCPSVDTLKLTVNHGTHNVFNVDICESYSWYGTTYTTSGTYTHVYTNASGCASADTLHLTIHNPVHTATSVTTCNSYTWVEGTGMTYTTSGTYTYAHQDVNGCTQVDTLILFINNSVHTEITVTECGNYYWNDNNYTSSGDYTGIFPAANGCDSIVTLHLTIIPALQDIKNIVSKKHNGIPYMLVYPEANLQYQWYKNGVAINNATRQYYYPADYALESSLDMDACYQVFVAAMDPGACAAPTDCWTDVSSQSTKICILPNPNNGQFRLMIPEGTVNVQILDVNGQVVMTRKVDGDEMLEMNTGLANGLYFVKTFRADGSFNTEKLVINR